MQDPWREYLKAFCGTLVGGGGEEALDVAYEFWDAPL